MNILRSLVAGAALLTLPVEAQEHRFEADPVVTVRENLVACEVLNCSASWTTRVPCLPANVCRCAQEIGSAFTQGVDHTSASIRTTRFRPANGRTRKRYRNNARSSW